MNYKSTITVQETVDFVSSVVNTATVDGTYIPALMDYAIRVNSILYFSDYEFERDEKGLIKQDESCVVAFTSGVYEDILKQSSQLYCLVSACKEQVRLNLEQYKIDLSIEKQLNNLLVNFENIFSGSSGLVENLGIDTITNAIQRLSKLDGKSIIDAIADKHELKAANGNGTKPKKPYKPRAKKDNIDQIEGQISMDELVVSE